VLSLSLKKKQFHPLATTTVFQASLLVPASTTKKTHITMKTVTSLILAAFLATSAHAFAPSMPQQTRRSTTGVNQVSRVYDNDEDDFDGKNATKIVFLSC
jgi:hypothetical protein